MSGRLYASDRAGEISRAKNSHEATHPADQFEAFAKLLASGLTKQQVANRFGVSVLMVQQRMMLASLAPRFIALFRADKISMDQLQVLAHSPDYAVQIAAWGSLSEYQRSPYMLKQALTTDEVVSDSHLAKFVGLDVYTDAGGTVRRDLFGEPDECWLQDVPLLHRLALDRLDAVASVEREAGWSWVKTHGSMDYSAISKFERQWPATRAKTTEEANVMTLWEVLVEEAVAARGALLRAYEAADEGSAKEAALASQLNDAETAIENLSEMKTALEGLLVEWASEQYATCGVIVKIDHQGRIDVRRGLMRLGDRKAHVQSSKKAGQPARGSALCIRNA